MYQLTLSLSLSLSLSLQQNMRPPQIMEEEEYYLDPIATSLQLIGDVSYCGRMTDGMNMMMMMASQEASEMVKW